MRLIFIRHGDPNYEIDSLTPKGWKEADLLAQRIKTWPAMEYFVSPLGRAQDTARICLEPLGITPTTLPWIQEFHHPVYHPDQDITHGPWDFYPSYWTEEEKYYNPKLWGTTKIMAEADIQNKYETIRTAFDNLLENYGFKREKKYYTTKHTSADDDKEKSLVFFCHFGITALIMSHLLNISPLVMLQSFFMPPTALTILASEERVIGEAAFRTQVMGDTSHLLQGGEKVSASGYYTSVFSL